MVSDNALSRRRAIGTPVARKPSGDVVVSPKTTLAFLALSEPVRIRYLLTFIRDNRARWDNRVWFQPTAGGVVKRCLGGWAYVFGTGEVYGLNAFGHPDATEPLYETARVLLGLTQAQATALFYHAALVHYREDEDPFDAFLDQVYKITRVRLDESAPAKVTAGKKK